MKEATWVVIGATLIFIGVRLGVLILPQQAQGYVNLAPAAAPESLSSSPEAGAIASPSPSPSGDLSSSPAADGGVVDMGGADQW